MTSSRTPLRPAFVITLMALSGAGCESRDKPPQKGRSMTPKKAASAHVNPPPVAVTASPEDRKMRSRVVRTPLPPLKPAAKQNIRGRSVNPQTAIGRVVFARSDGHCFVNLPRPEAKPLPGSHDATYQQVVDCPDAMLDPAWDTCLSGRMRYHKDGQCACHRDGNPPPPVAVAECPKQVP